MKKRVLSIVCVIALVATMISAGAIYAIGTNTAALTDEAFSFDGSTFVEADWTATNNTPTYGDGGIGLSQVKGNEYATVKYKDSYNLTNGFTLEYAAKGRTYYNNIYSGSYYVGVQIGNITVAMDEYIKPVILVDGEVKATGNEIITFDATNPYYNADKARNYNIREWLSKGEGAISTIKYTVTYDAVAKTVTYAKFSGDTQVFTLTYTDTADLIDVTDADVALYHNNSATFNATYKSIKLTGAPELPPPSVLYGTGLEFSANKAPVASDWTFSHATSTVGTTVHLNGGNVYTYLTGTYKDTFILTDGFTLSYSANGNGTKNYKHDSSGFTYLGAVVGNVFVGLEVADADKTSVVMVIKVDGTTVATSDSVFDANHAIWNASKANGANMENYFGYYPHNFTLNYDPEAKTLTYTLSSSSAVEGTLTYTDTADAINVDDAALVLKSHSSWSIFATYKALKLDGAVCTSHVYDDDNDTTCDKCGDVRDIGGGEPGGDPSAPKGEALTEAWAPETFVDTDWTGDTSAFNEGKFVMSGQSEEVHKDIWTAKKYDLSAGFKFKATLTMRNGHNNYYGEWCSAYFGAEDVNLELRIKNDGSRSNPVKDDTYTAILLYNGEELATCDLDKTPNGEYEVTYKNGKISVALAGVKLVWTLADTSSAADIPVTADLSNAKVGLRLTDNYGPKDGREWKTVSLAPLPQDIGGGEGEEDDVVKGETLTSWTPEQFVEADWVDSEGKFTATGEFLIAEGNGTKTIWTVKNYDMSEGFKFKGTLAMKNGYNNYYGEWCSAYFGNERVNLELRIKNDSPNNEVKDNTYTAYLLYNGEELASSDLLVLPNGEYELSYKDGKVSVSLGGVALKWTLADSSEATSIAVEGADFTNAKLGLRLTGNYCPNGRKWSAISLTSLSGNAAVTGDARNIVIPAVVMLVSAVTAAFVLLKKKARA